MNSQWNVPPNKNGQVRTKPLTPKEDVLPPPPAIKTNIMTREEIYKQITAERIRQDIKFGPNRNHHPIEWTAILGEEFGEVSREAVEYNWSPDPFQDGISANEVKMRLDNSRQHLINYREELIQVSAVAVAMIESLDMYHLNQ